MFDKHDLVQVREDVGDNLKLDYKDNYGVVQDILYDRQLDKLYVVKFQRELGKRYPQLSVFFPQELELVKDYTKMQFSMRKYKERILKTYGTEIGLSIIDTFGCCERFHNLTIQDYIENNYFILYDDFYYPELEQG